MIDDTEPGTPEGAFLAENAYAHEAVKELMPKRSSADSKVARWKPGKEELATATALSQLAVAYELRQNRFELDERLRNIEMLLREGNGW